MKPLTKEEIIESIKKERRGFFGVYATAVAVCMILMKRVGRTVEIAHGQNGKMICFGVMIFLFMVLPLIVYFVSLNTSGLVKKGSFVVRKDVLLKKSHFTGDNDYFFAFENYKKGKEKYRVLEDEYDNAQKGDEFYLVYAGPFKRLSAIFPVKDWELSVELQQKYKEY